MESKAQLISFKVSHYCEKVRWAMDRLNIPYSEEFQMPKSRRSLQMWLIGYRMVEHTWWAIAFPPLI